MLNLITTGASYIFPGGRALKLVKNGIIISNSTNILVLTKNITLTVIDCYTPPPISGWLLISIGAGAVIAASVTSPNLIYSSHYRDL